MDKNKVQSIFINGQISNFISCSVIWIGSVLLCFKIFSDPAVKIILFTLLFILIIVLIEGTEKNYHQLLTKNVLFIAMLILTGSAIILFRLDRGNYPIIAGFTFLWIAAMYFTQSVKVNLIQITLFLLSPVLFVEALSFSGYFTIAMLVILSIFLTERFLEDKLDWKLFLIASLFGVTFYAQPFIGLIYISYILFKFRYDLIKGIIFTSSLLLIYLVFNLFLQKDLLTTANLSIDSLSWWIIAVVITAAIYAGWIVTDLNELFFANGLILFSIFAISFLIRLSQTGWNKSISDFAFLLLAVPFLILSIKDYRVDKFLGKILY